MRLCMPMLGESLWALYLRTSSLCNPHLNSLALDCCIGFRFLLFIRFVKFWICA